MRQSSPSDAGGTGGTTTTEDAAVLKTLTQFVGDPLGATAPWQSGQGLVVDGALGDINVIQGNSTSIAATFTPFVMRAFDTPDSEILADFALLETTAMMDASGTAVIRTSRLSGAPATLGADIVVEIPAEFDAELHVIQRNGSTRVASVALATALSVESAVGDVQVSTGSVQTVVVSAELGDLEARIERVPANAPGGRFESMLGNVLMSVPSQNAFSVMAIATEEVRIESVPAQCTVAEAAFNSKTLTCNGGGAIYEAEALGIGGIVELAFR